MTNTEMFKNYGKTMNEIQNTTNAIIALVNALNDGNTEKYSADVLNALQKLNAEDIRENQNLFEIFACML